MKIIIELSPYDSLAILRFLSDFEEEMLDPRLEGLRNAIRNYRQEVYLKVSLKNLDDAEAQLEVNKLLGRDPD